MSRKEIFGIIFYGIIVLLILWVIVQASIRLYKAVRERNDRAIINQSAILALCTAGLYLVLAAEMHNSLSVLSRLFQ